MSEHPIATFWIPLLLALFGLLGGIGLPALSRSVSPTAVISSCVGAAIVAISAGALAYRTHRQTGGRSGGRGGNADVSGHESTATGGSGGASRGMGGGDGGHARVRGYLNEQLGHHGHRWRVTIV